MTDSLDRLKAALSDRYTVERELGRGGTATVYLATDLRHDRPVALKVLSPELASVLGPDRFLGEIKTTARLTHPHILPLLDSGEADGLLFYVMPFVDGESLRERLKKEKQLPLDDALRIAREVSDALSYAHAQGVIHRDVKPENILLESGHAVVADFGIARAINVAGGERLTETGIAIGTPAYMSPEQASGSKDLDGRSDLYSLGCVLYEMLAGQPPFTGPTVESLVIQHLSAEPPSVTSIRPSVPGWVAAALSRALAKTPADRFNPVAQFGEVLTPGMGSEADAAPTPSRRGTVAGITLATAVLLVLAILVSRTVVGSPFTITTSNIKRITYEPGLDFQPAISPDGDEVAYVVGPLESSSIVVRSTTDVGTSSESRLVGGEQGYFRRPSWTPNGAIVRFWGCMPYGQECGRKEVGMLGGAVRTVSAPRPSRTLAWSSDGARLAFPLGDSIFACLADACQPERVGVHPDALLPPHSLAWSPDGRWIAYVHGNNQWRTSANINPSSIWILDSDGGEPVQVTDHDHLNVSPQWLPDSRHLLFVSDRDGRRGIHVVEVGSEGAIGQPTSVPGSSDPHSISVSADGKRLAFATFTVEQNIWSVPVPGSVPVSIREAVPVTTGHLIIEAHDLSPDGEWIAYDSQVGRIYKRPLEGGDAQVVADMGGSTAFAPRWSPDGTEIAFYGGSEGNSSIWVVSAAGGEPEQLTDFPGWEQLPRWSPDGLSIAYTQGNRPFHEWILHRDSVGAPWHEPVQLTEGCAWAEWAPDGTSLVCPRGTELLRISPAGDTVARIAIPPDLGRPRWPQFSPDGSRVLFFGRDGVNGAMAAWSIPVQGGNPSRFVVIDEPLLTHSLTGPDMIVGPDNVYFTLAQYEADIWVMDLEW